MNLRVGLDKGGGRGVHEQATRRTAVGMLLTCWKRIILQFASPLASIFPTECAPVHQMDGSGRGVERPLARRTFHCETPRDVHTVRFFLLSLMIGSLLLSDALTSKFFSVLFLGKLHVFLMRMCFPSEGCWDLGEVSRSKPK